MRNSVELCTGGAINLLKISDKMTELLDNSGFFTGQLKAKFNRKLDTRYDFLKLSQSHIV